MAFEVVTNAEHALQWAVNSAPHYKRLCYVARPGNFMLPRQQAYEAFQLASDTLQAMIRAGDLAHANLEPVDILDAAKLILEWRPE